MLTQEDIRYFDEARKQIYQFQAEALEAKNFETVAYLRGQAEQLARLINLQDTTTSIRKASADEDEE